MAMLPQDQGAAVPNNSSFKSAMKLAGSANT